MQGTEKSLLALGQSEQGAGRVVQVESESLKDLSFYTKGNGEPLEGLSLEESASVKYNLQSKIPQF